MDAHHDPHTDPRATGGPVDAGSLLMQWGRCRADLAAAVDLAREIERDPEAPPWAQRLARSQRQSLYALLSLGSLLSAAARATRLPRSDLRARLSAAWWAFRA